MAQAKAIEAKAAPGTRAPVDLALAAVLAVAALLAGLMQAPQLVLGILGLPLVLLLPGYAIVSITHPAGPQEDTPTPGVLFRRGLTLRDRLLFSVVLSVIATTGIGLVLGYTPIGVSRVTALVALAGFTLLALALGLAARMVDTPADQRPRFLLPGGAGARPWHEWLSIGGLALALMVLGFAAVAFTSDVTDDGYVSLFLEPNYRVECYPLNYAGGAYSYNLTDARCPTTEANVTVTINNHERGAIDYVLRIGWSQEPGPEGAVDDVVRESRGRLEPVGKTDGLAHQLIEPLDPGAPPSKGLQYLKVQLFIGTDTDGAPDHALQLRVNAV